MLTEYDTSPAVNIYINDIYSGVFLQLDGVRLPNNSLVDIDDIPDENIVGSDTVAIANALMCMTDLVECCNAAQRDVPGSLGEWYYPDGSLVKYRGTFRRNRGRSVVRLWRNNNPMERGRFYCELPDAQTVNQTNYVNICKLSH